MQKKKKAKKAKYPLLPKKKQKKFILSTAGPKNDTDNPGISYWSCGLDMSKDFLILFLMNGTQAHANAVCLFFGFAHSDKMNLSIT